MRQLGREHHLTPIQRASLGMLHGSITDELAGPDRSVVVRDLRGIVMTRADRRPLRAAASSMVAVRSPMARHSRCRSQCAP